MELIENRAGSNLYWRAYSVKVNPLELGASLDAFLPEAKRYFKLAACEPKIAIRRSIRRRQGAKATIDRAYFWREKYADADRLVVVLADEKGLASDQTYTAQQSCEVEVDLSTGTVQTYGVQTVTQQESVTALLKRYDIERGYLTSQDISLGITKTLAGIFGAHSLKPQGGLYFIPKARDENLIKLQKVFEAIDGIDICFDELLDKNVKQIAQPLMQSIEEQAQNLLARAKERQAAAERSAAGESKAPKWDTIAALADDLRDLQDEAKLLNRIVGITVADIEATFQAISTAERAAVGALTGRNKTAA